MSQAEYTSLPPTRLDRPARRRKPLKRNALLEALRARIVDRTYTPGQRLPTYAEISRRFKVSVATTQQAMDQLADEGFVVPMGPRGTFVAERPPHLSRYGLVLRPTINPPLPSAPQTFSSLLLVEALLLHQRGEIDICVYEGIHEGSRAPAYAQLCADIQAQRLAGIIVAVPWTLAQLPVMDLLHEHKMPAIGVANPDPTEGFTAVTLRPIDLIDRAVADFATRGRRRVALLDTGGDEAMQDKWMACVRRHGLITHPFWFNTTNLSKPHTTRNCMHLLMRARERPDALLIADDSLVEPATAGLRDTDVPIPKQLDVLVHCNFPYPAASHVPVRRLGFDLRQILKMSIGLIDQLRAGRQVPQSTVIPVRFEHELPAAAGDDASPSAHPVES